MRPHRQKLEWARRQFDALNDSIQAFCESKPYEMVVKFDLDSGEYVAKFTRVDPIPDDWSLRIGDIVHSLRSSLDNLAYQLAIENLRVIPPVKDLVLLQFVIVDIVNDEWQPWKSEAGKRLKHLSTEARDYIRQCQPRHGVDGNRIPALAVLRDLSNIDKHRHIVPALTASAGATIHIEREGIPTGQTVGAFVGAVELGVEFGRWFPEQWPVSAQPNFHANPKMSLEVRFAAGRPAEGGRVDELLGGLIGFLDKVIFPPLEDLLEP